MSTERMKFDFIAHVLECITGEKWRRVMPLTLPFNEIAKIAHEINRAYCKSLGDESQLPWNEAPGWQIESAYNGVKFHYENPNSSPAASHESWLKQKIEEGWRYGPVKDAEKKEHPCCVEYHELPVEQRAKDFIFSAVCRELFKL